MSSQSEKEFLSAVALEKLSPFKDGKIEMGGENEIQLLIKFYLENKKVKKPAVNAQRFKINCIVGENGVGKSRLLKKIIDINNANTKQYTLLDDFFILSSRFSEQNRDGNYCNLNNSIFKDNLPSGQNYGFNGFLSGLFIFDWLNNLENHLSFFSAFHSRYQDYSLMFSKTKKPDCFPFREKFIKSTKASDIFWSQNQTMELKYILEKFYHKIKNKDVFLKYVLEYISQKTYYSHPFLDIKKMDIQNGKSLDHVWNAESKNKYWSDKKNKNFCQCIIKIVNSISDFSFKEKNLVLTFLFEKVFWNIDLVYNISEKDDSQKIYFSWFSSGEKIIALRLWNIYREIIRLQSEKKKDFLILIDEPDLHLHLDWQRQYIQKLIDVFATLPSDIKLHFIIATHSPFLISDLPTECMIALKKDNAWNTEVLKLKKNSTFWANFVDLIRSGFFFKNQMLMWSFAEAIIKKVAEDERRDILNHKLQEIDKEQKSESLENIKKMIWDDFLRDNLLYFKPY